MGIEVGWVGNYRPYYSIVALLFNYNGGVAPPGGRLNGWALLFKARVLRARVGIEVGWTARLYPCFCMPKLLVLKLL